MTQRSKSKEERRGTRLQDVDIKIPHGDARSLRSRRGDGRPEDDRRATRDLGTGQDPPRVGRQNTDFPLRQGSSAQFPPVKVDSTFRDNETISLEAPSSPRISTRVTRRALRASRSMSATAARPSTWSSPTWGPSTLVCRAERTQGRAIQRLRPTTPTFMAQKDMKVDVWLASHASQFQMHEAQAGRSVRAGAVRRSAGFSCVGAEAREAYLTQLAEEKAGK